MQIAKEEMLILIYVTLINEVLTHCDTVHDVLFLDFLLLALPVWVMTIDIYTQKRMRDFISAEYNCGRVVSIGKFRGSFCGLEFLYQA